MRSTYVQVWLVISVAGAGAGVAAAQEIGQREPRGVALAKSIAGRSRIRVRFASGLVVELQRPAVESALLIGRVGPEHRAVQYQVEEVEQVWRRGNAAGLGGVIGAGIGLVGGAITGAAITQLNVGLGGSSRFTKAERFDHALILGVLGGLAGGTVGLLLGTPFGKWNTAFRSRRRVVPVVTAEQIGVRLTW
jgi:hypothetical protein